MDDLTVLLKEKERGRDEDRQRVEAEWAARVDAAERERAGQAELIAAMRAQLDSSIHIAQQLQTELEEERERRERSEKRARDDDKKEKEVKHREEDEDEDEQRGETSAELHSALARLREECARLQLENAAYASELSAFDESFFDEIEDLKYRYSQAVKLLQQMREAGYSQPPQAGGFG